MSKSQLIQASSEVPQKSSGAVEEAFLESGALSITLQDGADQPILEPGVGETPLWDKCVIRALFAADVDTESISSNIVSAFPFVSPPYWELVEDKDWSQEWKKHFRPIPCDTGKLWICPSWIAPPNPDAVNLHLDPGLAFGTGSHPTTMLCLNWLETQPLNGKLVVDYGCGSGILGIAALLLGASKVLAIDNDPQALLASRDNARRNGIEDEKLVLLLPDQIPNDIYADIVVANILANPLIELAEKITGLVKANGTLCLSGVLNHQASQVAAAYHNNFEFEPNNVQEDWVQLAGQKNP